MKIMPMRLSHCNIIRFDRALPASADSHDVDHDIDVAARGF
jgi:hypothetical protein